MSITHEEAVKAAQAEAILDSDVFKEALENLKNEYTNIWLNTRDIKDTQIREDLHRSLLLLPEVISSLMSENSLKAVFQRSCDIVSNFVSLSATSLTVIFFIVIR